jgi:hypothetical protein
MNNETIIYGSMNALVIALVVLFAASLAMVIGGTINGQVMFALIGLVGTLSSVSIGLLFSIVVISDLG